MDSVWRVGVLVALAATWGTQGCELSPSYDAAPKSPGDNFYKLIVNGQVERYAPEQRYVAVHQVPDSGGPSGPRGAPHPSDSGPVPAVRGHPHKV
ncbi:unnamed protein product [Leptidea sinapis]|uniref:Uncharacterized protein n=1 Tax=Leptidea sinapis TaxID=189913 RepID=A0A5E4Q1K3_9NEOP|nr:unnamed protein product [Leptidea sinapis]